MTSARGGGGGGAPPASKRPRGPAPALKDALHRRDVPAAAEALRQELMSGRTKAFEAGEWKLLQAACGALAREAVRRAPCMTL